MKLHLAPAGPVLLVAAFAAPVLAQAPAPAVAPQASAPMASAPAATPRDPKSPYPGVPDGKGPTGPVQISILSPKPDEVIPIPAAAPGQPAANGAPVEVKVDLKNFETWPDGQNVHIVLDNLPYFVYSDLKKPWLFKKVPKGTHTLRVFPVRPWHEAIKEPGAFAMVTFSVGEKDGKNTPVPGAPLLTAVRPKGKLTGAEAQKVMMDFLVTGCTVAPRGTPDSCRVRYRLDDRPEVTLDKWEPVIWEGLSVGKHECVVGLTRDEKIVENGPFNLVKIVFEIEPAGAPGGHAAAPASSSSPAPAPQAPPPATH